MREIISKLQTMRKDADFEVMDHIDVFVSGNEKVEAVMMANAETIKENVLADAVTVAAAEGFTKGWDINGEKVVFTVVKK